MKIGISTLPELRRDDTDRNRTAPIAFTGNKFEFRMPGSTFSIAGPNIILNTIVAESLCKFADRLEKAEDFSGALSALIKESFHSHKKIVFNGNNYSDDWVKEAEKRGLSNLKTTADALPAFTSTASIHLFTKHHVFTETEIHSRYEILMEEYCKTLHIEALTMTDMIKKEIIPACIGYQRELSELLHHKKANGGYDSALEDYLLEKTSKLSACLLKKLSALEDALLDSKQEREIGTSARFYRDRIFGGMTELRLIVDELETLVAKKYWPVPTYAEMLYSVH